MMQIDVDAVLRQKLPRHYRFIPRFIIKKLSRIICQEQLNEMLRINEGKEGSAFCRGVIDHLHITLREYGTEHLDPAIQRIVIVCNHPLGGLDGMAMIDIVARRMGIEPWFVVNDILMAIPPLRPVFLPVNKHGAQSRESLRMLDQALAGDRPVIIFPAGLVSRKAKDGAIADLQWQRSIVNKCIKHKRDIVPAYFDGTNSNYFYNFARRRTRLGLKLNIEMIRLPREILLKENANLNAVFGATIPWQTLKGGREAQSTIDSLRQQCYSLRSLIPQDALYKPEKR